MFSPCLIMDSPLYSVFTLFSHSGLGLFFAFKCTSMFLLMLIMTITFPATLCHHVKESAVFKWLTTRISGFVISSSASCPCYFRNCLRISQFPVIGLPCSHNVTLEFSLPDTPHTCFSPCNLQTNCPDTHSSSISLYSRRSQLIIKKIKHYPSNC